MDDDDVALAGVLQQRLQGWAVGVFAAALVGEDLVCGDILKLALVILVRENDNVRGRRSRSNNAEDLLARAMVCVVCRGAAVPSGSGANGKLGCRRSS